MLISYKHTAYFVASNEEISQITNLSEIYELCLNKKGVDSFGGFDMVFALSRIFFKDEQHIPSELEVKIADVSRVFQCGQNLIDKIGSYKREEMDSFAYLLREDYLCTKFGFEGMGIWVFLYEIHDCCSLAIKTGKNLYLVEENSEYIFHR